jgi:hypothetical protein
MYPVVLAGQSTERVKYDSYVTEFLREISFIKVTEASFSLQAG